MKKVMGLILVMSFLLQVAIFADEGKEMAAADSFRNVFGLSSMEEVTRGVFVYEDGRSAEMSLEDVQEILQSHWNFSMDRDIEPVDLSTKTSYVNIYTQTEKFTLFLYGEVLCGTYGEGNYLWYKPYIGNARNALYIILTEKDLKYREAAKPSDESIAVPQKDYLRLPKDFWAVAEIEQAAKRNILPYELAGQYENPITREEFCNLAVQMLAEKQGENVSARKIQGWDVLKELRKEITGAQEYVEAEFVDMEFLPYAVNNMALLGIVNGRDDGTFDPRGSITREEAAKILEKIAALFIETSYDTSEFHDNDQIAHWARGGAYWCKDSGVMQGVGDNLFAPQESYTRQQAIATMVRLMDWLQGE